MTHAVAHKHENEEEWLWRQKRDALSTAVLAQLVNWQYGGKSTGKNRYSVERPEMCNSSGGNEEKQNEDVESVMARLYPSGRGQGGERKKTKKCKSTCSCRHHIFVIIRKSALFSFNIMRQRLRQCKLLKNGNATEASRDKREVSRDNLKKHPNSQP